ncbi:hypothetical protein GBF38_013915 [Nibea albiflora]|uniref:Uncharacterized protein n=1 Tax=Nibea albiflora TaxID=240163 RepID=A0ACB7F6Q1_NIBAL|nr:hypothetical protein GBF38_013915 [Nibea albiflora]
MATNKQRIVEALEDLSKDDFRNFCNLLRDRRSDPQIKRRDVEDKGIWEIAELLVSKFTEDGAIQVAFDILRQMGRNEEAKNLEQRKLALTRKERGEDKYIRQASDPKREQFRRYLEKAGVVDSLTSGMAPFFWGGHYSRYAGFVGVN